MGSSGTDVAPEVKAFLLKSALDAQSLAVSSAPVLETLSPRGSVEGPANQVVMRSLVDLRGKPIIHNLEARLMLVWNATE